MQPSTRLHPELANRLDAFAEQLGTIPTERRELLDGLADELGRRRAAGQPLRLLFVCTHNSRRSQMAQLWAWAAGAHTGLELETHSAGTEATAFDRRAVAAMGRAGFRVQELEAPANPHYQVRLAEGGRAQDCFSKTLRDALPPEHSSVAVMVCDEADAACPMVPGADARFALPYRDPKASDGTPEESATYDERCAQIAREMLYVVRRAVAARG